MPVYTDKQLDNMSLKQREQIKFYLHDVQTVQDGSYKDKRVDNYLNSYNKTNNSVQPDKNKIYNKY